MKNVAIHSHVTRQQNKLHTHKCKTSAAQNAIRCYGVSLLNEFSSKVCYKRALKRFLLNQVYFFCYKSYPLMYYTLFDSFMHFCTYHFLQIRKCNVSSLSLDSIYLNNYFICIILFCFLIVFLMTINNFLIEMCLLQNTFDNSEKWMGWVDVI